MTLPACVLWIDPGGHSGLARLEHGGYFTAGQWDFTSACDRIGGLCQYYRSGMWIGWERYRIDVRRPQDDAYDAIGVSRVAQYLAARCGCRILDPQDPGDRDVATPAMLKHMGWWRPGEKDANAASQHLAAWLLRLSPGNVPASLAVKLSAARRAGTVGPGG